MNMEKVAWAAVSGAILAIFWPWMLAQRMFALNLDEDDSNRRDST